MLPHTSDGEFRHVVPSLSTVIDRITLPEALSTPGLGMTSFELKNYVRAVQELTRVLAEPQKPLTPE